jgi:hypothetical protein
MFGGEPARRLRENIAVEVRRGSFDRPPIGPIGSLLSLSDDYWAAAVEQAIGKCFDGYLVASRQDVNTLRVCRLPPPAKLCLFSHVSCCAHPGRDGFQNYDRALCVYADDQVAQLQALLWHCINVTP